MEVTEIKYFIEAAMLAAGRPLNIDQLQGLFDGRSAPEKAQIREAIKSLQEDYEPRGIEIAEVASGFRMQVKPSMADRLEKLWEERPPRYSRALFETLALIAYRQPMTRGEIEEIRGVSVSANIIRSLLERDWIRVVGHRDVPGRPAMFGTTRQFLDYFGLKKLDDLPPLADLADWETLRVQLNLPEVEDNEATGSEADGEAVGEGATVTQLPVGKRDEADEESSDANGGADESGEGAAAESDAEAADEAVEDAAAEAVDEAANEADDEGQVAETAMPESGEASDTDAQAAADETDPDPTGPAEAADGAPVAQLGQEASATTAADDSEQGHAHDDETLDSSVSNG